jgi:DNA-binding transcriptional LysR family regulator
VPADLPERFAATELFADELVLITAPDHPTAGAGALSIAALRDEPFVSLPPASGLRGRLEQLAADAGFVPRIPFETANLPQLRDLVAHGLGVALVARSVAEATGRPVAVHQVDPGPLMRPVGLLHFTGRPLSPAALACRAFLLRAAERVGST